MANAINWFEIPAANLERASTFYGKMLGIEIHKQEVMGMQMGFLHNGQDGGVGGALVQAEGYVPTEEGALVYLNGGDDLSDPLGRVEGAGGSVIMPKTKISDEIGFMAVVKDVEGNRIALHSPN
ncbi:MAG: VOC family protein [Cyclobacteriaceae bacterium]